MDLQTFLTGLEAFTLLPAEIRDYARDTAPGLADAERAELMAGMTAEYARIKSLEKDREQMYADAGKKLTALLKSKMPAIRREVEKAEQASDEDAAAMKLDANI